MGRKQNGGAKVVWRERLSRFESGNATQLAMLLNGVDLHSAKRRKRYSRVA